MRRSIKNYNFMIIIFFMVSIILSAQTDLETLRQMWKHGDYSIILNPLKEYRESNPHDAEVDYMIATCACQIKEKRGKSIKVFDWILQYYPLSDENINIVKTERNFCYQKLNTENITRNPNPLLAAILNGQGSSYSSTKIHHIRTNYDEPASIGTAALEPIAPIPKSELDYRIVNLENREKAEANIRRLSKADYIFSSKYFALSNKLDYPNLEYLGAELDNVLEFYCNYYDMKIPENFISVYVVQTDQQLAETARKVHSLEVKNGSCIGYSFHDDQSIVAIMNTYPGTIRHELFHLLDRKDFGDIPPWLDEGIAALYEVSDFVNDSILVGINNWRALVLDDFNGLLPSINSLITMNWEEFNGHSDFVIQAANHAAARYFAYYLQENGNLNGIYKAFRSRDILTINEDFNKSSENIITSILNKDLSKIQEDFEKFCEEKIDLYSSNLNSH